MNRPAQLARHAQHGRARTPGPSPKVAHGATLSIESHRIPDDGSEHDLTVSDYSVVALPGHVGKRAGQPQFGVLDLVGTLDITDPAAFVIRLGQGFGRAKAFGCGLMLIRRAAG